MGLLLALPPACGPALGRTADAFDVDALLAQVFFDGVGVLDLLLGDHNLFLRHGPLFDDDLLFGQRDADLVFADVGARGTGSRSVLHANLFAQAADRLADTLGIHVFADAHFAGRDLAPAETQLLG